MKRKYILFILSVLCAFYLFEIPVIAQIWVPFQLNVQPKAIQFPVKNLTTRRYNFTTISSGLYVKEIVQEEENYKKIFPPGGKIFGDVGDPGLPGFTRLVAVPKGAEVQVSVIEGTPEVLDDYMIYPVQVIPEDNLDYEQPPFAINQPHYQTDVTYPDNLYSIEYDWVRGCKIAKVNVHTARYNPVQKRLYYYPHLEVDIQFLEGDDETFIALENKSRFFEGIYAQAFPNYEIARSSIADLIHDGLLSLFCDLLIITPSDFEAEAEELAEWKREKGILTKIATLDDIDTATGGTTADDIRDYIKNVYDTQGLSYVLLFGDADFIPPHYVTPHPTAHSGTHMGTDLYYAEMDYAGYFPDLAIGRIPVESAVEAQTVVNKIINYEQDPPTEAVFYETILCAAFFQDDDRDGFVEAGDSDGRAQREFAETMEEIHDFFVPEGYDCPRVYATDSPDPQEWRDGTAIPAYLRMPGFAWDGDADDIIDIINEGTFLVAHRDHADRTGWGDPDFHTGDLANLTNDNLLPVVLSINCQTGWFDNETDDAVLLTGINSESFAEEFLLMEGEGAVGVIAATRNSPSYPNNALTEAFIDCIWNGMLPAYPAAGDADASALEGSARLGDALNYAKFYVATQYDGVSACQRPFEIYHVLGDPTMEIWTENPEIVPFLDLELELNTNVFRFPVPEEYPETGIILSLLQEGEIIGQGIPIDGEVEIALEAPLAYSDDTAVSVSARSRLTSVQPVRLKGEGICYRDADGDGYGDPSQTIYHPESACPEGYVSNNKDCNDQDKSIHPGAKESCDRKDNDCDGKKDEGCISTRPPIVGPVTYPFNLGLPLGTLPVSPFGRGLPLGGSVTSPFSGGLSFGQSSISSISGLPGRLSLPSFGTSLTLGGSLTSILQGGLSFDKLSTLSIGGGSTISGLSMSIFGGGLSIPSFGTGSTLGRLSIYPFGGIQSLGGLSLPTIGSGLPPGGLNTYLVGTNLLFNPS